jgi:hypothetical protein
MSTPAGSRVGEAPLTGGPYVRQNGIWVQHVFGQEYQLTPLETTPLALTLSYQTYVQMTTTSLVGGLYRVILFLAASGSSSNSKIELRVTISDPSPSIVFQTLTVDQTYTGAGDVLSFPADIPVGLAPLVHTIEFEARQPTSPGLVTAVSGGIQLFRVQ